MRKLLIIAGIILFTILPISAAQLPTYEMKNGTMNIRGNLSVQDSTTTPVEQFSVRKGTVTGVQFNVTDINTTTLSASSATLTNIDAYSLRIAGSVAIQDDATGDYYSSFHIKSTNHYALTVSTNNYATSSSPDDYSVAITSYGDINTKRDIDSLGTITGIYVKGIDGLVCPDNTIIVSTNNYAPASGGNYVMKSGDTMTGDLIVPNQTITYSLTVATAVFSGDVDVIGTVDGRDISDDGLKLDDISISTGSIAAAVSALQISTGTIQLQVNDIAISTGTLMPISGGTMTGDLIAQDLIAQNLTGTYAVHAGTLSVWNGNLNMSSHNITNINSLYSPDAIVGSIEFSNGICFNHIANQSYIFYDDNLQQMLRMSSLNDTIYSFRPFDFGLQNLYDIASITISSLTASGDISANAYYGNGSNLIGISGDNFGNHIATTTLNMNGNTIINSSSMTMYGTADIGGITANTSMATTGKKAILIPDGYLSFYNTATSPVQSAIYGDIGAVSMVAYNGYSLGNISLTGNTGINGDLLVTAVSTFTGTTYHEYGIFGSTATFTGDVNVNGVIIANNVLTDTHTVSIQSGGDVFASFTSFDAIIGCFATTPLATTWYITSFEAFLISGSTVEATVFNVAISTLTADNSIWNYISATELSVAANTLNSSEVAINYTALPGSRLTLHCTDIPNSGTLPSGYGARITYWTWRQ